MGHTIDAALWRKSSDSGSNGGNGPVLVFNPADWRAFTAGLKRG